MDSTQSLEFFCYCYYTIACGWLNSSIKLYSKDICHQVAEDGSLLNQILFTSITGQKKITLGFPEL